VNREIFRYIVAGGLAFGVDFSVLYVCTEFLGLHYLISNLFGYFSGLVLTYILNTQWVFSYRRYEKTLLEFLIFNAIVIAGLGLSEGLMAILVGTFGLHYLYAKIVTGFVITVFNYVAKKFILFHPPGTLRRSPVE
jgi:putative flippase GtrA